VFLQNTPLRSDAVPRVGTLGWYALPRWGKGTMTFPITRPWPRRTSRRMGLVWSRCGHSTTTFPIPCLEVASYSGRGHDDFQNDRCERIFYLPATGCLLLAWSGEFLYGRMRSVSRRPFLRWGVAPQPRGGFSGA
jgi:hypothetical protein